LKAEKAIFYFLTILTFLICGGLFIYYSINAESFAVSHIEPQVDFLPGQIGISILICIIVRSIESIRKNKLWLLIPLIIAIFSVLNLVTIVPCSICGIDI